MGTGAVHPTAASFALVAGCYDDARPDYPADAVAHLTSTLGAGPGSRLLDLAAGTGKLTARLVRSGADLVAVDPIREMLARLRTRLPSVAAVVGTAEAVPLATSSVHAVTVAQAFHWFDGPAALDEIVRVLRPGGALAVVWNRRDPADPLWERVGAVVEPHRGDAPAHRDESWRRALDRDPRLAPLTTARFPHRQDGDRSRLRARIASVSFVAGMPADRREALLDEVVAAADDLGLPAEFPLRYVTDIHTTRTA